MQQVHLLISGLVQGVGYRQFVRSMARKNYVTGWVKNLSNGQVEAVLQGREQDIKKVITACEKGPVIAEVKDVAIEWEEGKTIFKDFVIEH